MKQKRPKRRRTCISLTEENTQWLEKMVESGDYRSFSAGVEDCVQKERKAWEAKKAMTHIPPMRGV